MVLEGFLYLHRKLAEWEWYDDANTMRLFIHCLIFANYKEKQWRGICINRGQFVTSQSKLAQELKLSIQNIRTALNKLKLTGELTVYSTADYSIITVKNYDLYQPSNRPDNSLLTDNQQAINSLLTTTNKDNKDNKEKNNKYNEQFLEFYNLYPKQVEKQRAYKAYLKAIKTATHEDIMQGLKKYIEEIDFKKTEKQYIKHPATWLNAGCWEDDYEINKQEGFDYDSMPYNAFR